MARRQLRNKDGTQLRLLPGNNSKTPRQVSQRHSSDSPSRKITHESKTDSCVNPQQLDDQTQHDNLISYLTQKNTAQRK